MLSKKRKSILALVIASICALLMGVFSSTMAEDTAGAGSLLAKVNELDLDTAVRIALAQNPSLEAARARVEQAREVIRQAKAAYWPRLDASVAGSRLDMSENTYEQQLAQQRMVSAVLGTELIPPDDPAMYYQAQLTASWLVFDGFARKFKLLAAEYGEKGSAAARDETRRLLLSAVITAFLQAQLAQENIIIANADLAFNERLLTEAKLRYQVGTGSLSDVLNFEVKANSAQAQRIRAERTLRTGLISLAALLGVPGSELPGHVHLAPLEAATERELASPSPSESVDSALALRPDLQQGEHAVQQADAGVRTAGADYYPTISLTGSYEGERYDDLSFENDDFGNSITMSLSYNIFAGGLTRARQSEARLRLREAQSSLKDARLKATSQVLQTIARVGSAQDELALQQANTQLVRKNRDLVEKEYKAGVGSLVRLNEAQRDLTASRVQLAASRVALRQAWYDLQAATGQILQQFTAK